MQTLADRLSLLDVERCLRGPEAARVPHVSPMGDNRGDWHTPGLSDGGESYQ